MTFIPGKLYRVLGNIPVFTSKHPVGDAITILNRDSIVMFVSAIDGFGVFQYRKYKDLIFLYKDKTYWDKVMMDDFEHYFASSYKEVKTP